MEEFKEETGKDETLQLLSCKVIQGWPDSVKKIDPDVKPYRPLRDDISIEDGLIFLGSCVIVRESLRGKILQQIHGMHPGTEKCNLRAKSCVNWPGIYKEIENLINSCCLPEVPQFPAKRAYDTIRDPFKTVTNSGCRSVLCTTGMVPRSCRLLLQIPIC